MIEETIQKLEKKMQSVDGKQREALLQLMTELKDQIRGLPVASQEQGESIVRFTDASAHELIRSEPNKGLLDIALQGMSASAQELESTHPKLVHLVNSVSEALAQIGV